MLDQLSTWIQAQLSDARGMATPICWLLGPPGAGKTARIRSTLDGLSDGQAERCNSLWLSTASPDRCLTRLIATTRGQHAGGPVTTTDLKQFLGRARVAVLDALDVVQDESGNVLDARLEYLLALAAAGRLAPTALLVSSRFPPPPSLPATGISMINVAADQERTRPPAGSPAQVLDVLVASREATSGWLIGLMTGDSGSVASLDTPAKIAAEVRKAVAQGWVQRAWADDTGEWFDVPEVYRRDLPGATRKAAVMQSVAQALQSPDLESFLELATGHDPELARNLIERLTATHLELGDVDAAVQDYWSRLGNFSQLRPDGMLHLGARVCRTLNGGLPPAAVSPALRQSEGAWAVINDWGQFGACLGNAHVALPAAHSAFALRSSAGEPVDQAWLASHVADALCLQGGLRAAREWAERSWTYATQALRQTTGYPTREVMEAFDAAARALAAVLFNMPGDGGLVSLRDALVAWHERAREMLAEFNASAVIPIPGPQGPVDAGDLLEGHLAALIAFASGQRDEAAGIIGPRLEQWRVSTTEPPFRFAMRALRLRARLDSADTDQNLAELAQLRELAAGRDDAAAECEIAALGARLQVRLGHASAALEAVEEALVRAAVCGLGLQRSDLLVARSQAFLALGKPDAARSSTLAALHGTDQDLTLAALSPALAQQPGALDQEYRWGVESASNALRAAGGALDDAELATWFSRDQAVNLRHPKRRARSRPTSATEQQRRASLHEAALAVIDKYRNNATPFGLFLRKYDIEVLHGPFEFGGNLLENALWEALPEGVELITVQDQTGSTYSATPSRFGREAPGLVLQDRDWKDVVAALIPLADFAVVECTMLSQGVRHELDLLYRYGRWDRTVVLLPPFSGAFALLDSDELIQMFPRCIWMDEFHTDELTDSPLIGDLINRTAAIAALSDEERRSLLDPSARDERFPIDLGAIARRYEARVVADSVLGDTDDKRLRYYDFWQLFRAASIRSWQLVRGDESMENRMRIADADIQMSAILLDYHMDGTRFVLEGDLAFAEQCAQSAWNLIRDDDQPAIRDYVRGRAAKQYQEVLTVRKAVEQQPDRFVLEPRYGPFKVDKWSTNPNET